MPFEVPESWEWAIISDISTSIQYGYTGKAISEGKYKMLRITDIQNNSVDWASVPFVEIEDNKAKDYLLFDSNILFARTGATVGKSFLIENLDEKSVFASYLIRINTSNNINARYLNHFLDSDFYWKQIMERSIGTGQPNVNGTILGELKIPIPPYVEQQRIVNEIQNQYKWISIIDESKQVLDELIQHSKSKILDLAIRGKLVPQDPNDEPASILLEQIRKEQKLPKKTADKFPYPFEVPESWEWCKLGEIGDWQSGSTPSRAKKEYYNGDINWLKTGDLTDDYIYNISEKITQKALLETSVKLNPIGSVLIAMYGATIGKVGILTQPATTNQACCACSNFRGINNLYLFYLLIAYRDYFIQLGEGGAQPNISKEKIISTDIPLPPLSEQQRIVEKIEEIFKMLDKIEENIQTNA